MRHLALIMALLPLGAAAETTKKWTHGRSACDPVSGQAFDSAGASSVERASLERALEYAISDVEALGALRCFAGAEQSAVQYAQRLRSLGDGLLPGLRASTCEAPKPRYERFELVKTASGSLRVSETFFEDALNRYDAVEREIAAAIPQGGVAFDDCRAKAQRGWARARASLNRLSCEVGTAAERMENLRERAEQSSLAALECAPPPAAVAQAAPAGADASSVLMVAPAGAAAPEPSGYQAFPGALVAPPNAAEPAPANAL